MILELLDDAVLELEEQAAWYEERREGLGVEFLSEVRAALGLMVRRCLRLRHVASLSLLSLLRSFIWSKQS